MSNDDDKKIFIDEGWKAQVQREKEEALKKSQAAVNDGAQAENSVASNSSDEQADAAEGQEVDASFSNLIASLAAQAMFALGVIAPQGSKQVTVNIEQAKFFLDTLTMLQEKTKGNLTQDETQHLEEALGELAYVFETRLQQIEAQAMRNANIDLNNLKTPEA